MAIHAVAVSDLRLLRVIGIYLFVSSAVGVAAFPRSPLWILFLLSPLFIVSGLHLTG